MAEFVFYFLKERIQTLWEQYQKINSIAGRYKLSYQKGILEGFQNKLNKMQKVKIDDLKCDEGSQNQNQNQNQNEIVLLLKNEDKKLNEFTKNLFPKLSKKGASSNKIYTSYFDEGKSEGKKININKPMTSSKKQNIYFKMN